MQARWWPGTRGEALIRKSIKELDEKLDPGRFVQPHRAVIVIVNFAYVRMVTRGTNETAELHLRGCGETLPVSRSYLHHFRQMQALPHSAAGTRLRA